MYIYTYIIVIVHIVYIVYIVCALNVLCGPSFRESETMSVPGSGPRLQQ